jgi:hypothetical protein
MAMLEKELILYRDENGPRVLDQIIPVTCTTGVVELAVPKHVFLPMLSMEL